MEAYIMIGIPGSGKSTLASEMLERMPPDACIVSLDACREQLYGDPSIQGEFEEVKRLFHRQLKSAAEQGYEVIVDNCNAHPAYRRSILQELRQLGYQRVTGIYVDATVDKAMKQQQNRERQVPRSILESMSRSLSSHPPTQEEGFDFLIQVESDSG